MSSSLRPGQAILHCLALEEVIDRFLLNVGNYKSALCNNPKDSGGSLKSHEDLNRDTTTGVPNCFDVYELGYVMN